MVLVIQNIEGGKAGRILLCRKLNFQRSAHQASPLDLIEIRLSVSDYRQLAVQNAPAGDLPVHPRQLRHLRKQLQIPFVSQFCSQRGIEIQDNDIHFNQLCKEDGSRVKYKKICAGCGKEVGPSDIVKGFEYEPNKYVTLTDDDFEKAKSEKDKAIHILHFTELQNIRPIYFDKTYHVIPEQGGDKAFELLRRAMLEENKIAVAKTVMGTKEKLLALIPTDKGILAETLFFWDEIKESPKEPVHLDISDAELQMAKTLIGAMGNAFKPEQYKDEYREKLWQIIQAKIQGKEIAAPKETIVNVIDLMDALKQSLAQADAAT